MTSGKASTVTNGHAYGVWTRNASHLSPLFTRRGCASYSYR